MAPTRPSIMSEGAMMSQPACACTIACLHQHRDGLVVEDDAIAQQPVMAVAGEGVERHVAQHPEAGNLALDGANRPADQVVRVNGLAAGLVAQGGVGIGKERDAGDGQLGRPLGLAHGLVDRKPLDPGHGGHRNPGLLPVHDEQRPDQVIGGEDVFPHHPPRPFAAAVTAQAGGQVEPVGGVNRRALDRGQVGAGFDRTPELDSHSTGLLAGSDAPDWGRVINTFLPPAAGIYASLPSNSSRVLG